MVSMTTHNPFPSSPRKQEVLLCPKRWDKPQKQTTGGGVGLGRGGLWPPSVLLATFSGVTGTAHKGRGVGLQ